MKQKSTQKCIRMIRNDVLLLCLRGEELENQRKKMIRKSLMKLCNAISNLWAFSDIPWEEAMDAEEKVIRAVIPDGNYQHFHMTLSFINLERAKTAMHLGDADRAVKVLSEAQKHAEAFDKMDEIGIEQYTCPVLSGYTEDHRNNRKEDWNMTDEVKGYSEKSIFDPLRNREDFKALFP